MRRVKIMIPCVCCGQDFQFGPHLYDGKVARLYGNAAVCLTCWDANWDGWSPSVEPQFLKILEDKGLPVPARNAQGWLPRGD